MPTSSSGPSLWMGCRRSRAQSTTRRAAAGRARMQAGQQPGRLPTRQLQAGVLCVTATGADAVRHAPSGGCVVLWRAADCCSAAKRQGVSRGRLRSSAERHVPFLQAHLCGSVLCCCQPAAVSSTETPICLSAVCCAVRGCSTADCGLVFGLMASSCCC